MFDLTTSLIASIARFRTTLTILSLAGITTFPPDLLAANVPPALVEPFPDITLESGGTPFTLDLAAHITDPDVPGTAVRVTVRIGAELKQIDLALFDAETPETVANFHHYIESGAFSASFIHRSVPGFIIQGGGFRFIDTNVFDNVPTIAPVTNEPGISNLRGTIAMAKLGGDPDSATSQWFINLDDNAANLDEQNGGFTVFGRVLGTGMSVADEIAALPIFDARSIHGAWRELPLYNYSEPLHQNHFVETEPAIISPLDFSVTSADPDLVTAEVIDGQLHLTPSNERSGATTVTITATDLDGATLHTDALITVIDNYSAWSQRWDFPSSADSEPTADADGDGWLNLLEFAFGGNPLLPSPPPHRPRQGPSGILTFGHLRYSDLQYTAWVSGDLQNWTAIWSTTDGFDHPAVQANIEGDGFHELTIQVPEGAILPAKRFWRVTVNAAD